MRISCNQKHRKYHDCYPLVSIPICGHRNPVIQGNIFISYSALSLFNLIFVSATLYLVSKSPVLYFVQFYKIVYISI